MSAHYLKYFRYRRLLINFQRNALEKIAEYSKNSLKYFLKNFVGDKPTPSFEGAQHAPLLELSLKDYFSCLSFPFNISYIEYDYEGWNDDSNLIYFPDYLLKHFEDFELLELLFVAYALSSAKNSEMADLVLPFFEVLIIQSRFSKS